MFEEALTCLREADSFAAIEFLNQQAPATAVLDTYAALVEHFAAQQRDPQTMTGLGRAGLQYGLDASHRLSRVNIPAALALRGAVAALAGRLAALALPGATPGPQPGPAETRAGGEAAALHLRLCLELDRPPGEMRRAYELLGQHLAAAGAHDGAAVCAARARQYAARA